MRAQDAMSSLTSTFDDWAGLLANPRFARQNSKVGWIGFKRRMLPFRVLPEDLTDLADNKQYSFQVADGSIFQICYQFNDDNTSLLWASLGFYKNQHEIVHDLEWDVDSESLDENSTVAKKVYGPSLTAESIPWIRLDYDPTSTRGVIHTASHLQMSLAENLRLPVAGVPTPKQFVEAVIAWFYPEDYELSHLNTDGSFKNNSRQDDVNSIYTAIAAESNVLKTLHLMIPPITKRNHA